MNYITDINFTNHDILIQYMKFLIALYPSIVLGESKGDLNENLKRS